MKRNSELIYATIWGLLLVVLAPRPAYAYIDPGVGLLLLQGLAASVVGGLFFARRMIYQVLGGFFRKGPKPAETEPKQQP